MISPQTTRNNREVYCHSGLENKDSKGDWSRQPHGPPIFIIRFDRIPYGTVMNCSVCAPTTVIVSSTEKTNTIQHRLRPTRQDPPQSPPPNCWYKPEASGKSYVPHPTRDKSSCSSFTGNGLELAVQSGAQLAASCPKVRTLVRRTQAGHPKS